MVALDLLEGVAIGLAISIFFVLQGNMKRAYYLSREELAEADAGFGGRGVVLEQGGY